MQPTIYKHDMHGPCSFLSFAACKPPCESAPSQVLDNLGYASYETVVFQCGTVIVSELLLLAATWYATRWVGRRSL